MPQRMRYRWFVDRPRNVSRQDYDRYQLILFGAMGLGLLTLGFLFSSIGGLTLSTSRDLAEIDGMTVEEALAYDGDSPDLVKIEGFLLAETPATMPDDEQQVIRGRLQVTAREPGGSGDGSDTDGGAENAEAVDSAAALQPITCWNGKRPQRPYCYRMAIADSPRV